MISFAESSAAPAHSLRRVIGFFGGTALVIGITIGSGIFRKPATIAALVPDPRLALFLWLIFGIISLCGALTLAELASMLPQTGGLYVYLRLAYGEAAAFVFGWLYILITSPAALAALATVFIEFLVAALGLHGQSAALINGGALATILLLAGLTIASTRWGAAFQSLFTTLKICALLAIIGAAFFFAPGTFAHLAPEPQTQVELASLARAVGSVIWAYDGWIGVSMIAGEVVAPDKLLKKIIVSGTLVIVALYLAANLAYIYVIPAPEMALHKAGVATHLMSLVAGPLGGTLIALGIMASVLGSAGANLLARPRVAYAMANDGLGFRILGHKNHRFGTPDVAIAVQAAIAIILVLTLRDFDKLTTYFVVVEWLALIFGVGSVLVLRRRMPEIPRPFRTPWYPFVPLVFMIGTFLGLACIIWGEWQDGNFSPLAGIFIAACGYPMYRFYWRKKKPAHRIAVAAD